MKSVKKYKFQKKPVLLLLSLPLVVILVVWLIWSLWQPSFEKVFWQTINRNLSTRSLSLTAEVTVQSPQTGDLQLLKTQMDIAFAPQTATAWRQSFLTYDHDLMADENNPTSAEVPNQEWYHQTARSLDKTLYAKHRISTQPVIANWVDQYELDYQRQISLDNRWHSYQFEDLSPSQDFQKFLMNFMGTHGFLYGYLDYEDRQKLLKQLRQVYLINFEEAQRFTKDGRLYYQYEVRLEQSQLGQMLLDYFNANTAKDDQKIQLTKEQAENLIRLDGEVVYQVVIDVWARRITQISYNFTTPFVGAYSILSEYGWQAWPHYSPLIEYLYHQAGLRLKTSVSVTNQNQFISIERPSAVELSNN